MTLASTGSIPACAGNPKPSRACAGGPRVHPRVCGESSGSGVMLQPEPGPSPRVRGILRLGGDAPARAGSIPACAGNPVPCVPGRIVQGVHPRVCGESMLAAQVESPPPGPSPRVRGIPAPAPAGHPRAGSIPACAGNPHRRWRPRPTAEVHPRVCGESAHRCSAPSRQGGPSPRVRGIQRATDRP